MAPSSNRTGGQILNLVIRVRASVESPGDVFEKIIFLPLSFSVFVLIGLRLAYKTALCLP